MSEKHSFSWLPSFLREHRADTPTGQSGTSVNPPLAKAGELNGPSRVRSITCEFETGLGFTISGEEAQAKMQQAVFILNNVYVAPQPKVDAYAASRAASGGQNKWHGFIGGLNGSPEFCKYCGEPERSYRHELAAPAPAQLSEEQLEKLVNNIWHDVLDSAHRFAGLPNDEESSVEAACLGVEACKQIKERLMNALLRSQPAGGK